MATKTPSPTSFGAYLRSKREARQISAAALADEVGVSRPYICLIEKDRANPPCDAILFAAARYLDVSDDEMFLAAGRLPPDVDLAEALALYRQHHVEPKRKKKPTLGALFDRAARNAGFRDIEALAARPAPKRRRR